MRKLYTFLLIILLTACGSSSPKKEYVFNTVNLTETTVAISEVNLVLQQIINDKMQQITYLKEVNAKMDEIEVRTTNYIKKKNKKERKFLMTELYKVKSDLSKIECGTSIISTTSPITDFSYDRPTPEMFKKDGVVVRLAITNDTTKIFSPALMEINSSRKKH